MRSAITRRGHGARELGVRDRKRFREQSAARKVRCSIKLFHTQWGRVGHHRPRPRTRRDVFHAAAAAAATGHGGGGGGIPSVPENPEVERVQYSFPTAVVHLYTIRGLSYNVVTVGGAERRRTTGLPIRGQQNRSGDTKTASVTAVLGWQNLSSRPTQMSLGTLYSFPQW